MQMHRPGLDTSLSLVASVILVVAALAASGGAVLAMPPAAFTLSPSQLTFEATADVQSYDYDFVTLTTGPHWLIYQDPATTTGDQVFWDTQAGSCWQGFESLGNRIPGKTTCTLQIGFHSEQAGTFNGQLVVYQCTQWHLDPTFGMILCDATGDSKTVDLVGTALPPA
jgi:hypothetical protein